jgi:hypothetical protein
MLLENRAEEIKHEYEGKVGEEIENASGIIFRAPHCQVVSMAKDIYLRTGSSDGEIDGGNIVLDADKGNKTIVTVSNSFVRILNGAATDVFYSGDEVSACNQTSRQGASIDTPLVVNGSIAGLSGNLYLNGWIMVKNGHIVTQMADTYSSMVPKIESGNLSQLNSAFNSYATSTAVDKENAKDVLDEALTEAYYADEQIGNDAVQKNCTFSLRNEKQYNTKEIKLPETYWQYMLGEETSDATKEWNEPVVTYQNYELMPYPGKKAWEEDNLLRVQDNLHDRNKGQDIGRTEDSAELFEDPKLADWSKKALKTYTVIAVDDGTSTEE